jgi:hypothetical protein
MEAELNTLDDKLSQLVQLCHRLRNDNNELRQELVAARGLRYEYIAYNNRQWNVAVRITDGV